MLGSEESGSCLQQTLGDPDICIAIIDSRVDLSHPCFAGALLREVMPAWLQSVMEPAGASHGTHVASVIFGQPGGPVKGIAPRCRGVIIPVYGETEGGDLRPCSQHDLAGAISLALQAGAHLINISGGELIEPGDVDPFLAQIVSRCDQLDVAVIAASGNDGCECLHAPASLPTVLAVGAADAAGQPMPFSNWDESLASHGILAPGEGILGADAGNGVARRSGTSFACPIVTGTAASLLSLQKLGGDKPSPKAVRDAIIHSAVPCTPAEGSSCERMLGGRLDVGGACDVLFASNVLDAGRSRPAEIHRRGGTWSDGSVHSFQNLSDEGTVMANEHSQVDPRGVAAVEPAVVPHGVTAPLASHQTPALEQQTAVQPQGVSGTCSCGGHRPQQDTSPSQLEQSPQREGWVSQQSSSYQSGIPTQAALGQPTLSPAQRTAMMIGGLPGPGGGHTAPSAPMRGVMPSQTHTNIPMPTDFVTAANSQLVYIVGTLGYDFITDARRDYFVQQFADMSADHEFISGFTADLGLTAGPIYLPEDNRAMSAYLSQSVGPPVEERPRGRNPQDIGSLMWVLFQENQPLYALRPLHTLALAVLATFANFLYDQSRLPTDEQGVPNPNLADRVSIAGRIIGDITLYNGQQVPVLDVSLRALFEWKLEDIITDALGSPEDLSGDARVEYDAAFEQLRQFLDRVYYELRNMGQAPSDRAINYLATNVFQAKEAFIDAVKNKLVLDSIYAEKSPLCRPKSDCWDVIMRFFDPLRRLDRAVDEYRLTVDVNDMAPVGIGKLRKWARFA
jgi:cyanobactin maturation PatA/PatG family protease